MGKRTVWAVLLVTAMIIAGCSSPEENIYSILEETAVKEKDFENQQKPLAGLEEQEKKLFDQIMALGMKDFEKINTLTDEALENLDKREELIDKEQAAIEASKKEFEKLDGSITKLKEEDLKKQAADLQDLMDKRFKSHDALYSSYKKGLEEDRKLYKLLQDKDLKLEQLESQIASSNKAYESIFKANKEFNELTALYNDAKTKFYQNSGINIENQQK
ncbi:MAG TPA: YkyA family protein [Bacillaceae bacterium]